ncbi:Allantoinase [Dimargaris cristalligena]|uniref:allantoinase n=1 Tax=Dimargaris cristalligena TaxID=215637 RepID=A0A4P9ZXY9_9FUNG|nr:Allantoinase [Dimargaris cristalligena]RKP37911.1 hypothetical protein BJ085DRAFT_16360 [Dimargaris cristalligena]|eukprot:RKP37911.1 hypothetical protein BJ085DRAFT_16360 [Dimargaris cristalligena]
MSVSLSPLDYPLPAQPTAFVISGNRVLLNSEQPGPRPYTLSVYQGLIHRIIPGHFSVQTIEPHLPRLTAELPAGLIHDGQLGFWDIGDLWLMPGVIDAHVHVNQPGRTLWEGMTTASQAAAAGGCTTIVDMPLNAIPPTTTVDHAQTKVESVGDSCWVDVALWGGMVPGNDGDLLPLRDFGVRGFKGFLIDSGVPEFPMVESRDVLKALQVLEVGISIANLHATTLEKPPADPRQYTAFLESRPAAMEVDAIHAVISWLEAHPAVRGHIVHLSAAEALPLIKAAKARGVNLTIETCFHYLALSAQTIPAGATQYKCCPPIRDELNRDALWAALEEGLIDLVVSDHSPSTPDLKCPETGDFLAAWGGIASVQFGLSVLWTEAKRRGYECPRILLPWLCERPAQHIQLDQRKGRLQPGMDADMVIWDPEESFVVTPVGIHFRHKVTPYLGHTLYGRVHHTLVRGRVAFSTGLATESEPRLLIMRNRPSGTDDTPAYFSATPPGRIILEA